MRARTSPWLARYRWGSTPGPMSAVTSTWSLPTVRTRSAACVVVTVTRSRPSYSALPGLAAQPARATTTATLRRNVRIPEITVSGYPKGQVGSLHAGGTGRLGDIPRDGFGRTLRHGEDLARRPRRRRRAAGGARPRRRGGVGRVRAPVPGGGLRPGGEHHPRPARGRGRQPGGVPPRVARR